MKSMKMVIKMGKSSEPNTTTRKDIRSNTIIQYTYFMPLGQDAN